MNRAPLAWLFAAAGALGCGGGGGSGGQPTATNHSPTAVPDSASRVVVMGQPTKLHARASDQDGDALSYSWAQTSPASPQGAFSSTTSEAPTWTAPTVGATTLFTLSVTVSDGRSGPTSASVSVYAKTSSDPSFIAEVVPILQGPCMPCHGDTQALGHLVLDARNAYAGLVEVPAFGGCANLLRVKPGDPDSSVLILKMSGVTCGLRMPPPEQTYYDRAADELALVRTWILEGAPNN